MKKLIIAGVVASVLSSSVFAGGTPTPIYNNGAGTPGYKQSERIADTENRSIRTSLQANTNRQAIANTNGSIDDLRQDLKNQASIMDGAMAQGIATSSLVMPYNVGKIALTGAVGHSGDANAMAGGIGMRFNENFTARANMAYDDGSENVSVGVGVGYEFN